MARIDDLLSEATAKLRSEAGELRATIDKKQAAFEREVAPLQEQLDELEAAIARIEGRPAASSGRRRAPRGRNRSAIMDALDRKTGRTAAEVSKVTGIPKPTVHATLAKLAKDGLVTNGKTQRGVEHKLK